MIRNIEAIRDWTKKYYYSKEEIQDFFAKSNAGLKAYNLIITGPALTTITITEQTQTDPQTYEITTDEEGNYKNLFFFHANSVIELTYTGSTSVSYTLSNYIDTISIS